MNTEEITKKLAEIIHEVAGTPIEEVSLEKSFANDLDVDSLAMVEVIWCCQEEFGVEIPDEESGKLIYVKDAVSYIANRL